MKTSGEYNDTATTEIYTHSLHDALPISDRAQPVAVVGRPDRRRDRLARLVGDRRRRDDLRRLRALADPEIGRAHVCTPVTPISRMPSSALKTIILSPSFPPFPPSSILPP